MILPAEIMNPALFIVGTSLGSFLNVVAMRWLRGQYATGRSECPHCHKVLRWWELVPLISYAALRGRCARCRAPLSVQYPLVEITAGMLVMIIGSATLALGLIPAVTSIAIIVLLLILFVIDWHAMLLPDEFVAGLLIASLLYVVTAGPWEPALVAALYGASIGAGLLGALWVGTKGRGIGLGDVKLMVPLGVLFGAVGTITLLYLAFLAGGILGAWLLLRRSASLKTAVPFGPFLIGAALLLLVQPQLPIQLWGMLLGL